MPETRPMMPTAIDMIGCHAVANDATAATPVIVVSALAAESVCCIINYKDSNYGQIGFTHVSVASSHVQRHPSLGYGTGGCHWQFASNVQLGYGCGAEKLSLSG